MPASVRRRGARLVALLVLALLALHAAGARARPEDAAAASGRIRGRVELGREPQAPAIRPSADDLGMPRRPDAPDRKLTVVYLETAPLGAFEETARARVVLDQRNQAFVPYVLAIAQGTTVEFPNSDTTYHNVFSLSPAKRFDLGRYARGQSKSVRFDQPGVVRVFCEIHSHMSAYILVFAHRYFSVTDSAGRYRIDRVPPGTYTVAAWNDGRVRATRTVEVPASGGPVELDLALE